ncbi:hypothetical protein Goe21_02670 [Bacillus phage vB_BsuM-Goe21]|nr:hypothetical protein Goe21_02670 [Bacillus phage vB_BsuM-Goe21]
MNYSVHIAYKEYGTFYTQIPAKDYNDAISKMINNAVMEGKQILSIKVY